MRKFRAVFGLLVTPDFSDVFAGRAAPPRVDHSQVNFLRLQSALKTLFPYGPPNTLRIPNDTIDQVTLHSRAGLVPGLVDKAKESGSAECEDFGKALIAEAKKQEGLIIEVQKAWSRYHSLPDRNFAPPPNLIPFLLEMSDFEDAMLWFVSARTSLGLPMPNMLSEKSQEQVQAQLLGQLPGAFRKELGLIFGCKFEKSAILTLLATSSVPGYFKEARRQQKTACPWD